MITFITLNKKNITDFSLERNELLKSAKGDWIFFVDSDEIITPELKQEILSKDEKDHPYSGFIVKRKIVFLGRSIGEDKVLRLAKKGSGRWKRGVHEIWEVQGRMGSLNNHLVHNTATNLHQYIDKVNLYASLHAKENLKEGKRSNIFKITLFPIFKFTQNFLSGRGFVFSMLQAFHSFLAWSTLWELQKD